MTDERTTKLRKQIGRDRLGPVRHFEVVDLERYQEVLCMLDDVARRASEAEHELAESDIEVQRLVEVWLPSEARRWRVPPGSEDPSEDLPAAPGWRGGAA